MIHVFIAGSKGIPARYGGFETFAENLTGGKVSQKIFYHVSCMDNEEKEFTHNGAHCFGVRLPFPGAAGRIAHVSLVLQRIARWMKAHPGEKTVIYLLGCRIGPLVIPHARRLRRLGGVIVCNPDGLEWKRDKWNRMEKAFLRQCEKCLVTAADLVVCDSKNIQSYILQTYGSKVRSTTFIAYGAETAPSQCSREALESWYAPFGIRAGAYYLIVGRFVPENNYETMLREFMASRTERDLVIVTNAEPGSFFDHLRETTHFDRDSRIKFVGTVYAPELIRKIREEAYGYLHGHEVGGTNPSLLEALASTRRNLLLDVGFNREVGGDTALYWDKRPGCLAALIDAADAMPEEVSQDLGRRSTERIRQEYSWAKIIGQYEEIFLSCGEDTDEKH